MLSPVLAKHRRTKTSGSAASKALIRSGASERLEPLYSLRPYVRGPDSVPAPGCRRSDCLAPLLLAHHPFLLASRQLCNHSGLRVPLLFSALCDLDLVLVIRLGVFVNSASYDT